MAHPIPADFADNEYVFAWFCGIFEGEGHAHGRASPCIRIAMTDYDVMERVRQIMGAEKLYITIAAEKPGDTRKKDIFIAVLNGNKALALMKKIQPFMGYRRRHQIQEVLDKYPHGTARRGRPRKHWF